MTMATTNQQKILETQIEIGNVLSDAPELATQYGSNKMLPTADAAVIFAPVIRQHILVCESTRTRWLGNGYVVYDSNTKRWKRNVNITDRYIPVTADLRATLKAVVENNQYSPAGSDQGAKNITMRAQKSLMTMRKSPGAFRNVISTVKPLLHKPEQFFVAQTFDWMLNLTDTDGEIVAWRLSELSNLNQDAGYVGGVDWDRSVATELRRMDLVVNPGNRPTVRLDKDPVRDALREYIDKHTDRM